MARAVGGLIPQPDLWIVLDAPADVLQARVKEVSYEETARQRQAYCALGEALDNAVIIDAARPIERVTTDAVRVVLNCMAKRLAGRIEQRTH